MYKPRKQTKKDVYSTTGQYWWRKKRQTTDVLFKSNVQSITVTLPFVRSTHNWRLDVECLPWNHEMVMMFIAVTATEDYDSTPRNGVVLQTAQFLIRVCLINDCYEKKRQERCILGWAPNSSSPIIYVLYPPWVTWTWWGYTRKKTINHWCFPIWSAKFYKHYGCYTGIYLSRRKKKAEPNKKRFFFGKAFLRKTRA